MPGHPGKPGHDRDENRPNNCLRKSEIHGITVPLGGSNDARLGGSGEREMALRRLVEGLRQIWIFLIWIRCNPLKSPDSDEYSQASPSDFIWIGLVWLGAV
jgi:hypothetical protein